MEATVLIPDVSHALCIIDQVCVVHIMTIKMLYS